jgi:hypothetical protein
VLQAFRRTHDFCFSIDYSKYGYFESRCEPNADGSPDFDTDSLHFWISRDKDTLLMQSENYDGTNNFGIFLPIRGSEVSWEYFRNHVDEF